MKEALSRMADLSTVATGYYELLLDGAYGPLPVRLREALESALKMSLRAQCTVRGVTGGESAPGTAA